ncbi:MAG: SlyX family protein [Geobacteraceae bacterium]|nr:SlyX family protein [Geobacteraceae bacterium]
MIDRITDLEIQLTHHQNQVDELNSMVYRQQVQIDTLSLELKQIKEQLQIALPSLARSAEEEEPPPHY